MAFVSRTACVMTLLSALLVALPLQGRAEEPATAAAAAPPPAAAPSTAVTPPAAKETKGEAVRIGYVDMKRFGSETAAGKDVRAQLEKKSDSYRSQIAAKQKQLEKQKKGIQEKLPSLSPAQREAKMKDFEKKVEEYQKFVKKAENDVVTLEDDLSRKLYNRIEAAAGTYGKAKGYAAIVVKKDLLYIASGVAADDVTDEVMKLLAEKGK